MRSICVAFVVLLAGNPAWADGYSDFNSGIAAAQRGDADTAIRFLSAALSEPDLPSPLRVPVLLARGGVYLDRKQYDTAIADYDQAIAQNTNRADVYLARCAAYAGKAMIDKAIADCSSAIAIEPHNWRLHRVRNLLYVTAGQYDQAIADYTAFIAERPRDGRLLLGRAELYQHEGKNDAAIADIVAARDLHPGWPVPDWTLSSIYYAAGDFQKADDAADHALDLASPLAFSKAFISGSTQWEYGDFVPREDNILLMQGMTKWALGKFDDASDAFEKSLEKNHSQTYSFMWLQIVEWKLHANMPSHISARYSDDNVSAWLGAVVRLYAGKNAPDDVLKITGKDTAANEDISCLTGFYVGEWYLAQGDTANAKRLLGVANTVCRPNGVTRRSAIVELGRLS